MQDFSQEFFFFRFFPEGRKECLYDLGEPGKMEMEMQYNSDTMTLCMWRVIHIYINVGVMPHSINYVELKWG